MRAGIDVGGTFTDLAFWNGSTLITAKVPSTPDDQSTGVVDAVEAGSASGASLVHGTTVATNALLERAGATTALVTDAGFEDLLEIGRQHRPSLYDLDDTRPPPLVDAAGRLGVEGRSTFDGSTEVAGGLEPVLSRLVELAPESVAISMLYAFVDAAREEAVEAAVRTALPGTPVSRSSVVAPEFREYERASTTVINAYLVPKVAHYLERLGRVAGAAGIVGNPTVMRSSGGLIGLHDAARLPASIVLSGPAGGVVAAAALGDALGHRSLVSFDMGGTSTDVCRITDGRPEVGFEQAIGGLPNRMPSVAVHTVGAGGGSLGWVDDGGALRVGPRSAGAVPGPAAYGRGGDQATVTDANLLAGRLAAGASLGDSVSLDAGLARAALDALASRLGLDAAVVASGIIEVVEAHMERAVRVVSVEQGADPREAVLVAFGGAGALHATALARRLEMAGVLIPAHAGVFSAVGLLLAPPRSDAVRGVLLHPGNAALDGVLEATRSEAGERLGADAVTIESFVDVRYRGQSHELSVPLEPGQGWRVLADRFHPAHAERNGFARPGDPIEVVAVRAAALGSPALTFGELPEHRPTDEEARRPTRSILHERSEIDAGVWWRPALDVGAEVVGPAIIEEPEATTYLAPGERAVVHDTGALEVTW
jgi:N-methylhydantoinase A